MILVWYMLLRLLINHIFLLDFDFADRWLKKGDKFLEKQELWMRVFSLAPFLYGCNNIISVAWTKALINAQLLLNEKR